MSTVRGYFRPEFLNRIDEIVFFNKLRREDMKEIVVNQARGQDCALAYSHSIAVANQLKFPVRVALPPLSSRP